MRSIAVIDVPKQGKADCDQNALLYSNSSNGSGRKQGKPQLAGALTPNVAQTTYIDHADGDRENDRREHAARQILKRSCKEQQDQKDDARKISCAN